MSAREEVGDVVASGSTRLLAPARPGPRAGGSARMKQGF